MNTKQRKILQSLFENSPPSNLLWIDLENLLIACGAEMTEGRGSRVRFALHGVRAVFHRPHPQKEASKGLVKSLRNFLIEAGIKP